MNKIYFVIVFIIGLQVRGQQKLTIAEQNTLKEKVQAIASKTKSIMSDFEQEKHLDILDDVASSQGKMFFNSPNSIKWQYTTPYPTTAIFKNNLLLVNNEGKKDKIDLSSNTFFKNFNTLIINSIKGEMFDESQFGISYFETKEFYIVTFKPKNKQMKKFIASFDLSFDKNTAEVLWIKMTEPENDYTLITFKNRKTNVEIPDSVFELE